MRSILKDKKGDLTGVLYLIVMISVFAFFLLIVGYIGNKINTEVKSQINSSDERINQAFDYGAGVSLNTLSALWYIIFGGLLLGLIVTAWYMPTYPVFVPVFIFLLIIAIIVGVAMSNAYEEIYAVGDFEDIASSQTSINFMMCNLPYVALIVGVMGLIITFAKPKGGETTMM